MYDLTLHFRLMMESHHQRGKQKEGKKGKSTPTSKRIAFIHQISFTSKP